MLHTETRLQNLLIVLISFQLMMTNFASPTTTTSDINGSLDLQHMSHDDLVSEVNRKIQELAGRPQTQNSRQNRSYENCKPTKEEIIQLLVALRQIRLGTNMDTIITICNRRRPVASILTDTRILGR